MSASCQSASYLARWPAWVAALLCATTPLVIQAEDEVSACANSIQLIQSREKDFRCNHALGDESAYCAVDLFIAVRGHCSSELTVMATVQCDGTIALDVNDQVSTRDAALIELGAGGSAGMGEIDLFWPLDTLPDADSVPKLVSTSCKITERSVYPY